MAYDNCLSATEECKQETKERTFENAVGREYYKSLGLKKGEGKECLLISAYSSGKQSGVKKEDLQLGDGFDLH